IRFGARSIVPGWSYPRALATYSPARATFRPERIGNEFRGMMKREILRLAAATTRSALSTCGGFPVFTMCRKSGMRLAGWDGGQMRPLAEWRNRDEFVENTRVGFPVRMEFVEKALKISGVWPEKKTAG